MHDHLLEQQVVTSQSPGADSTYSSQFLKPIWIKVTSSENIQRINDNVLYITGQKFIFLYRHTSFFIYVFLV